jgi:hypothetical protein
VIEPARRHGHSDPRYSAAYFRRFSPGARAARADSAATTSIASWEDEGGAFSRHTSSAPALAVDATVR